MGLTLPEARVRCEVAGWKRLRRGGGRANRRKRVRGALPQRGGFFRNANT